MSAIFGELLAYPQEHGDLVNLYTFGDEFYARRETLDGFTVIYDEDLGMYCYAALLGGRFASTGVPISRRSPSGLRKHLKESEEIRSQKFNQRYRLLRGVPADMPPDIALTLGRENGLLEGRQLNNGKVRGLTILVEFADERTTTTDEDLSEMLNGDNYTAHGNFCSVKEYYHTMSGGRLTYVNDVFGPVRLPKNRIYYKNRPLMKDAVELAMEHYEIDLSRYDSKNEGVIDALSFVYAGRTVYEGWLWPHNHTLDATFDGYEANLYTIQSGGRSPMDLTIGTFCHESGHLLCRFPDLYDYGERDGDFEDSAGLGFYCLMSAGNHLDAGRTPAPICAYLRLLAGWHHEIVDLTGNETVECRHGDYGRILRYPTDQANEFFLVENRTQLGLDTHLPSSGLAVYHCDILGSNEWQGGTANRHYQVGLLQADGHLDLERNRNQGDATDLFDTVNGEALSDATIPSTRTWDGAASEFMISEISSAGDEMTFRVGDPEEPSLVARLDDVTAVDTKVMPQTEDQMIVEFTVRKNRALNDVSIEVRGIAENPQDLRLMLRAPENEPIALGNIAQNGLTFDKVIGASSSQALSGLLGKPVRGKWQLLATNVNDNAVARIDRMTIKLS